MILINGSPPLDKVENLRNRGILFAHAIDPLRTDQAIFEPVTEATVDITSAERAPLEIDRALRACITSHRPVYLEVHQGVWSATCDSPAGVLEANPATKEEEDDQIAATNAVVTEVLASIKKAKHPILWGGEMLQRLGLADSFRKLVKISKLPYTTTLMGKGLIPETSFPQQFIGVYDSKFVREDIKKVVENTDCVLALGTIVSDFYAEIYVRNEQNIILAAGKAVNVRRSLYPNVPLNRFLPRLIEKWKSNNVAGASLPGLAELVEARRGGSGRAALAAGDLPLTWTSFFDRLKTFLTEDMVVLTDTGLALFPSAELPIARPNGYLAQTAWLSIGYTGGATLGVALAEPKARPVALVGDGGFQMVPQAFSTLVRHKKPAILFILDNGLYGIEQFLIDEQILPVGKRFYRDNLPEPSAFDILPRWDYAKLAEAFGGKGFVAATLAELEAVLAQVSKLTDVPALVAVKLDPHALPRGIESIVHPQRLAGFAGSAPDAASAPAEQTEIALDAFN